VIYNLDEKFWILVEGPAPGDAQFAAQWLQSALRADRILQNEFSTHPDFRPNIERIEIAAYIEFASSALDRDLMIESAISESRKAHFI